MNASECSVGARALALALLQFVNKGGQAWPAKTTLVEMLNTGRTSVYRWQNELIEAGLLRVEKRRVWCLIPEKSVSPVEQSVPPAEQSVPPAEHNQAVSQKPNVPPAEHSVPPAEHNVPPVKHLYNSPINSPINSRSARGCARVHQQIIDVVTDVLEGFGYSLAAMHTDQIASRVMARFEWRTDQVEVAEAFVRQKCAQFESRDRRPTNRQAGAWLLQDVETFEAIPEQLIARGMPEVEWPDDWE